MVNVIFRRYEKLYFFYVLMIEFILKIICSQGDFIERNINLQQCMIETMPEKMLYGTYKAVINYYTPKANVLCIKTIITFEEIKK